MGALAAPEEVSREAGLVVLVVDMSSSTGRSSILVAGCPRVELLGLDRLAEGLRLLDFGLTVVLGSSGSAWAMTTTALAVVVVVFTLGFLDDVDFCVVVVVTTTSSSSISSINSVTEDPSSIGSSNSSSTAT